MNPLRILIKTLVISAWLGVPTARAQILDPTFAAPNMYAPGTVYSVTEQADGKLVAVGNFTRINGTAVPRLVRFNANGTLDAAFNQQVGSNAAPFRARLLGNGQYLLVGLNSTTLQAGGLTRPGGLLQLNADGSGDASFDTGGGPGSTTNSRAGIDDVLPLANGQLLAVGVFDRFSGVPASNLVRLNANGSVDATFRSGTGANGEVLTAVPVANGRVLIGGYFTEYNGFKCNGLARLNADGSFDTSFISPLKYGTRIKNITVQPDGRILAVGFFYTEATIGTLTSVLRLLDNGTLDNSFFAPGSITSDLDIYSYYGDALAIQNDGKILVMSTPTRPVARLNANGTPDQSYVSATDANYSPYSLTLLRDGRLLEAGSFTNFGGVLDQPLVRLTSTGSPDSTFQPIIRISGTVATVVRQADGKLVTGGDFSEINGQPVRRLTRFNLDGTLDASFTYTTSNALNMPVNELVLQPNGAILAASGPAVYRFLPNGGPDNSFMVTGISGTVSRILLQPDGRILAGGDFSSPGTAAPSIVRLTSTGSYDPTFATISRFGLVSLFNLYGMVLQPNSGLVVAGNFKIGSSGPNPFIMAYNNDGRAYGSAQDFASLTGISATQLSALTLQPDGKLLVGAINRSDTGPLKNLARLNDNRGRDASFRPPLISGTVNSLVVQPDNRILVGGSFTSPTVPANLARLLPDGSPDPSFGPTAVPNNTVRIILPQPDGSLVIGGSFTSVGGQPIMALARLTAPSVLHVKAHAALTEQTTAWPVPAHTRLHVALAPTAHAQQLELLDALGRRVRQQQLAGRQTSSLALEGLPAGIYLLRVTYAEGIVTRRVQVQ